MGLIRLNDALPLIQPHELGIAKVIRDSWASLMAYPKDKLIVLDATARANIMSCEMRFRGSAYFVSVGGRIFDSKRARLYVLGERLAFRFKKLDDELHSSNIATMQVTAIREQLPLKGIGGVSFIDIGYVLDKDQREVKRICAVCLNGDGNFWEYDLTERVEVSKVQGLFAPTEFEELEAEVRAKPNVIERRGSGRNDENKS